MCRRSIIPESDSEIQRLAIMQTPAREIIKAVMDRNIDEWLKQITRILNVCMRHVSSYEIPLYIAVPVKDEQAKNLTEPKLILTEGDAVRFGRLGR